MKNSANQANPETIPFEPHARGVATILILGGLLLAILGQMVYTAVPIPARYAVWALMLVGMVAFLLGGQIAVKKRAPRWLRRPGHQVAAYFHIQPVQVVALFFAFCFVLLAGLSAGHGLLAYNAFVSTAAWVMAVILVVGGALDFSVTRVKVHISRKEMLGTAVLFLLALLLRGLATAQIPTTFSGDEGSAGLFAVLLLEEEANNLLGLGWFSFPALYFGVQSVSIAIFGQTIEALRLTSALAGALTVVAVYWLGRALFDRFTGALAAIYLLASHYHIHFSRIGLNNVWDGLFGTVAILGLWDGWKNGRRLGFVICGLALGLGQYFYVSIRILPLIFLAWALIALLVDRARFRQRLPGFILAALIALVVFLPLGILFAQHPDEFNAPMQRVGLLGDRLAQEASARGMPPTAVLFDQMFKTAAGFTHEPLRLLYDPGAPLLLPVAAALFILGVLWLILNLDLRGALLLLPLIAVIASGALSQTPPASQRFVQVIPLVAVILVLPLAQLVTWLEGMWPAYRRVIVGLVVVLMVWLVFVDVRYYFVDVYDNYVLGGNNTYVAHEIAVYLQEQTEPAQQVYFFGFPRMGYFSLSTIPYLAPQMQAQDIDEPLTLPPAWPLNGPTLFLFLPERIQELEQVRSSYPAGEVREFRDASGALVFTAYEVVPQ